MGFSLAAFSAPEPFATNGYCQLLHHPIMLSELSSIQCGRDDVLVSALYLPARRA